MAQKVLVQLVDDLDGTTSTDVSTVLFGLDGVTYEIDLTEANAEQLRQSLASYVDSARRVGGRIRRGGKPSRNGAAPGNDASTIRAWALDNGFSLAGRGRIPAHVVDAYQQAKAEPAKGGKGASRRRGRAKRS